MKKLDAYQLKGGIIVVGAEKAYGAQVTKLAIELSKLSEYDEFVEWVDSRLPEFRELLALNADYTVENEEEE